MTKVTVFSNKPLPTVKLWSVQPGAVQVAPCQPSP